VRGMLQDRMVDCLCGLIKRLADSGTAMKTSFCLGLKHSQSGLPSFAVDGVRAGSDKPVLHRRAVE